MKIHRIYLQYICWQKNNRGPFGHSRSDICEEGLLHRHEQDTGWGHGDGNTLQDIYKLFGSLVQLYCWSSAESWRNMNRNIHIEQEYKNLLLGHSVLSHGFLSPYQSLKRICSSTFSSILFPVFCREETCLPQMFQMEITVWSVLSWVYQWPICIWKESRNPQLEELFPNRTSRMLTLEEAS